MKSYALLYATFLLVTPSLVSPGLALAQNAPPMKGMVMKGQAPNAADQALMASMQNMKNGMNMKPTGDPDVDFVRMMTPHHQGAVDMAKVELQYGKDPEMRQLASDIVAAQEKEIAAMNAWLAKHGK